ncbi:MAG: hypothetical protein R3304_02850 [Longimicrobiales bacterium]|nr:hypothetical protein [Longimicrobiales bacterium]
MIPFRRSRTVLLPLLLGVVAAADLAAQDPGERFGEWRMDSDRPAPYSNIMTYEPWGDGGMAITVTTTNAQGEESAWGYHTLFDGVFRPVWGQEDAETSVEWVDERTTRITNMRDGRVQQVIINTLSGDGDVIDNEYVRLDPEGKVTGVGHATYRRIR